MDDDRRSPRRRFGQARRQAGRSGWGRRASSPPDDDGDDDDTTPVVRGGRITRISAQVRDAKRSNIFLDGEFAFGMATDRVLREGLAPNDDLTAERVAGLVALDESDRATEAGMVLLSYRPRSAKEVRDRLARNGYSADATDIALEKLTGWGYLNDEEFARRWIENRVEHRPRGSRLLAQELRHKGIDTNVIGETIDGAGIDEYQAALEAGERKAQSYAQLDPLVARRRLSRFLARRGFTGETVRRATDALLNRDPDEEDGIDPDEVR